VSLSLLIYSFIPMCIKLKNEAAKNIFDSKKSLKILKVQSESLKQKFLQLFVTIDSINSSKAASDYPLNYH
jgi:D-lyxose ketol-isomerase